MNLNPGLKQFADENALDYGSVLCFAILWQFDEKSTLIKLMNKVFTENELDILRIKLCGIEGLKIPLFEGERQVSSEWANFCKGLQERNVFNYGAMNHVLTYPIFSSLGEKWGSSPDEESFLYARAKHKDIELETLCDWVADYYERTEMPKSIRKLFGGENGTNSTAIDLLIAQKVKFS